MKFRVWHNCQVGAVRNFYVEVDSIEQAWIILNTLWDYDLFQRKNRIKPDYANASGLEYFDEEEKDWCEWYDDYERDIKEHFEYEEKLDMWLKEHDGDDYCNYCIYGSECEGMTCGPDGPIEPPCASGNIIDLLDTEAILQDLEEEEIKNE